MIHLKHSPHLDDDQLVSCYFADRHGEACAPQAIDHLAACEACQQRYADWTDLFAVARADAEQEHDTLFTTEHLRQQAAQILRRLEPATGPARVISFPAHASPRPAAVVGRGSRWRLVAAAIAGLAVGLAGSGSYLLGGRSPDQPTVRPSDAMRVSTTTVEVPAALRATTTPTATELAVDDDAFLRELDFALEQSTTELVPFDVLTPINEELDALLR